MEKNKNPLQTEEDSNNIIAVISLYRHFTAQVNEVSSQLSHLLGKILLEKDCTTYIS